MYFWGKRASKIIAPPIESEFSFSTGTFFDQLLRHKEKAWFVSNMVDYTKTSKMNARYYSWDYSNHCLGAEKCPPKIFHVPSKHLWKIGFFKPYSEIYKPRHLSTQQGNITRTCQHLNFYQSDIKICYICRL